MSWLRHNIRLQIGLALLLPFMVAALIPGVIAPFSPTDLVDAPFAAPSGQYWLGTDELGRDVFSRLVFAARTDLKISLGATLIAAVIGVSIGLLTGYRGGASSAVALRVTDVMLAFPSILLALFLVAVVGPSDGIVILALMILYIPGFLRFARGMAMSLRERAFVEGRVRHHVDVRAGAKGQQVELDAAAREVVEHLVGTHPLAPRHARELLDILHVEVGDTPERDLSRGHQRLERLDGLLQRDAAAPMQQVEVEARDA